jgi:hypothetical protein
MPLIMKMAGNLIKEEISLREIAYGVQVQGGHES